MKRLLLFLLFASSLFAQTPPWNGIIDTSRAVDWSVAGIAGGIPDIGWAVCSTIAPYSGAATTINNAISSCGANGVVLLSPAGTYTLTGGINYSHKSNVVLRGLGADKTFLVFSGAGAGGYNSLVALEGSVNAAGFEQNVCDWTAGYSIGTTVITLANCGSTTPAAGSLSNLHVGSVLTLDQIDEAADPGTIWNCATQNVCSGTIQGGESRTDGGSIGGVNIRSQEQQVVVTNISGANITITPGIYMPNWRSGQLPQAWYATTTSTQLGLENLSYDNCATEVISPPSCTTASGSGQSVMLSNCDQCWVTGVRGVWANRSHVKMLMVTRSIVRSNYFFQNISHGSVSYGVECAGCSNSLIENNIFQQDTDSEPSCSGACEGNVIGYNYDIHNVYTTNGWMQAGFYLHSAGTAFNLWEGNIGPGYHGDQVHGTHHFDTVFRNQLIGQDQDSCNGVSCNAQTVAVVLDSGTRYMNIVGNVLGKSGYHNFYACVATTSSSCAVGNHPGGTGSDTMVYSMGYTGNGGQANTSITGFCGDPTCATTGDFDPQAASYSMRWGNYDVVTAAVRWCGNSSDPGWSTTCSSTSEVPTTLVSFANAVPANTTLPSSFYLASKPSWFRSVVFPPIGPDVTGGNISGVGGFANRNPAMDCYLNVMSGPTDGTGSILTFNANTCYSGTRTPPTNIQVIPREKPLGK